MPKGQVLALRWGADRIEVELGVQRGRTAQQSSLAVGWRRLALLFLAVSPGPGTGSALVVTLLAQLGVVAVTGLLNLRLPRVVG
ncbi:hypothetical protein ACFVY1_47820 [Streptomyces sp. NPDC058293]|uniref:hypothetical protein n=1 Tax=Streptomyces sp. NPDC058293 TaxID=3346429 RepID=UPI0036F136A5